MDKQEDYYLGYDDSDVYFEGALGGASGNHPLL